MSLNAIRENKISQKFPNLQYAFLSLRIVFVLSNSVDPHEMLHYAIFYIWVFTVCKSTHFGVTSVHDLTENHKYIFHQMTF